MASLDLAISRAKEAVALAHTYEKQALYSICTTRGAPLLEVSRHSTDFGTPNNSDGRWRLVPRPGTLGAELAGKVLDTEKQMAVIEDASQEVRALSEQMVAVATEGNMVAGETLWENTADALKKVVKQVDELGSTADQARCKWVEFRRRMNALTTSVAKTVANLDLNITRARQAMALAHTYEKQALYTVSTSRGTASRHSTDFGTPSNSEGRLIQRPGTLGGDLAGRVLDAEKQMTAIEGASQRVRDLSEQAVAVATEGDITAGERLAGNAATELENVGKQVNRLCSTADLARAIWVEFRRRLNNVTSSASATSARLDSVITQARRADTLAHSYEKQALEFISTTRRTAFQSLALYDADFFESTAQVTLARQTISNEAQRVRAVGNKLKDTILMVDANIGSIEYEAEGVRGSLEEAVAAAVDGDVAKGEKLTADATNSLQAVMESLKELCSTSEDVHESWIELSVQYWTMP